MQYIKWYLYYEFKLKHILITYLKFYMQITSYFHFQLNHLTYSKPIPFKFLIL